MALLHLLDAVRERFDLSLEVVHFNHGLREEAEAEARWVAGQARELGLPFHLRTTSRLRRLPAGVQEAARAWRQQACGKLVAERGAAWVATGHQRDDDLESILLKLLRGCHIAHIRGMAWRAGFFIRPLLDLPHARLAAYLGERGLEWLEDPSNRDPRYKRNRVRHELLPLLDELAEGGIAPRLEALSRQSRELETLLETFAPPQQNAPGTAPHWLSLPDLRRLPALAEGAALHRFVQERLPGELDSGQLERALALIRSGSNRWELDLPGGRVLKGRGERLLLEANAAPAKPVLRRVGGWRIAAAPGLPVKVRGGSCAEEGGVTVYNLPARASLELRPRHDGDRFHPPWKQRPVKVKDFLRDQHVPLWERDRLPCLVWEGRVIAIYPRFVGRGHDRPEAGAETACLSLVAG
jgi:tRNA(Ile)-lysidine synthase